MDFLRLVIFQKNDTISKKAKKSSLNKRKVVQQMKEDKSKWLWTGKPHNFIGLALNFTRFIITSEKLITRKGFLNIKEDEILAYRIIDKRIELPFGQRIFGCGTIFIRAKDADTPEKSLKQVKRPREVMAVLDKIVEDAKLKYKVSGRDMVGAADTESDTADDADYASGTMDGPEEQ
jgi:hypothetical protein